MHYEITEAFERSVIFLLTTSKRFLGALVKGIEADLFPTKQAKLICEACLQVFRDTGSGPGSTILLTQRLKHMSAVEGRLTIDQILGCQAYLEECEDVGVPDMEGVLLEMSPLIQQRVRDTALDNLLEGGDPDALRAAFDTAVNIGKVDGSLGRKMGTACFGEFAAAGLTKKLPTGMYVLDDGPLEGGAPLGQLFTFLGPSNAGKSTALSQIAAECVRLGGLCIYATNELHEVMVQAKIFSDLVNVPFQMLLEGDTTVAEERFNKLKAGVLYVKDVEPDVCTPAEIDEWRAEVAEKEGKPVDLVVVDYADRLSSGGSTEVSGYVQFKLVYQALANIARKHDCVVATASQSKDLKGKRYADQSCFADSAHKARISNVIVAINPDPQTGETTLSVIKQKLGATDELLGPFKPEWEFGRLCPQRSGRARFPQHKP